MPIPITSQNASELQFLEFSIYDQPGMKSSPAIGNMDLVFEHSNPHTPQGSTSAKKVTKFSENAGMHQLPLTQGFAFVARA